MGTSNFHTENAQATYVIDYGDNEFAWQECQEHLGEWIKELDPTFYMDDSIRSEQELRSYPTSSIGFWEFPTDFLGLNFEFRVNLFIRSGYYEAACLDYELEWFMDGDCYEEIDDILTKLSYDSEIYDIKPGIWAIHKSNLDSRLVELQEQSIDQIESILKQISTPYGVVAQFSNGETIYKEL